MRITKKILCALIFLCSQASSAFAGNQPSWSLASQYSKQYVPHADQASDGLTYLYTDTQVNIDTQEIYHFFSIKVTAENGLSSTSSLTVNYDSTYQSMHFIEIHIIRKGKVIDVLAKQKPEVLRRENQLDDGIVDGSLTSYLDVNDLRVGDILEYSYVIKGFNPIEKDFLSLNYNLGFSIPVGKVRVAFFTSDDSKYTYKTLNGNLKPDVKKLGDQTAYIWEVNDPKVILSERNEPGWYDPYCQVFFYRNTTWHQLAQYMLSLYSSNEKLSKEGLNILSQIKSKYKTRDAEAREVIRYVQNQIRYLGNENGIYSFKPRNPNVIIDKKSGDCKEKSWALCTLLQQLGVKAYPMLVNTYKGRELNEYPASLESFNHCVVCYVLNKDTLYVDPTMQGQGGSIQDICFPDYAKGLIINENTQGLKSFTYHSKNSTYTHEIYDIKDLSGNASLNVTTVYSGVEAESERAYFKNNSKKAIQDKYLEFYANTYPKIDTQKIVSYKDDLVNNKLTVYESYNLHNIWEATDSLKPKDVTTYFYANNLRYMVDMNNDPVRTSPMYLPLNRDFKQVITVHLPKEWNLKDEAETITGPGFRFDREVSYKNKLLTLKFHHVVNRPFITKDEYADYVAKNEKVKDNLSYGIVYYGSSSGSSQKGSISPMAIILAVLIVVLLVIVARKIYFYDPMSDAYYMNSRRTIGGWLVLPAIGISITPIVLVVSMITHNYFKTSVWSGLINPDVSTITMGHSLLILFEFIFNLVFIVFAILNNILLYDKRTSAPMMMITFYIAYGVYYIVDYVIGYHLQLVTNGAVISAIFRSLVSIAIWVSYFLMSERVKQTFTRRLSTKNGAVATVVVDEMVTRE